MHALITAHRQSNVFFAALERATDAELLDALAQIKPESSRAKTIAHELSRREAHTDHRRRQVIREDDDGFCIPDPEWPTARPLDY